MYSTQANSFMPYEQYDRLCERVDGKHDERRSVAVLLLEVWLWMQLNLINGGTL